MTKKDPAVLWYTNDFLEGTADMSLEEIGVYTILLCYQHRRGFLPDNLKKLSRLVRLPQSDFEIIWQEVSKKFVSYAILCNGGSELFSDAPKGSIINQRMYFESKKRANYLGKKAVFAIVGNWFRYNSRAKKLRKPQKEALKKQIDYPMIFDSLLNKEQIEAYLNKIADRFAKGSDQQTLLLENENVIENKDVIESINEDENVITNSIEVSQNLRFKALATVKFQKELCRFFAQSGASRLRKVNDYLQELSSKNELQEFIQQTQAYMVYKTEAQERIHGWKGYTTSWKQTDWTAKLKQLQTSSIMGKKKFSINR